MKTTIAATSAIMALLPLTQSHADVYVGGKLGWNLLNDACSISSKCDDALGGGIYGGYEYNDYLGFELSADHLGKVSINTDQNSIDKELFSLSLSPKFSLPLTSKLSTFAKIGAAYTHIDHKSDFVPTAGLGLEYKKDYNWSVRAEYQRFENFETEIRRNIDANFFSLGLQYKFGSPEPIFVEKTIQQIEIRPMSRIVTLTSPATTNLISFDLNSSLPGQNVAMSDVINVLNTFEESTVDVIGYTDNSGSSTFNKELSMKRAESISSFLVENGIKPERISVSGVGEANPVKSNDTLEGRKANRRVEITVPAFEYTIEKQVMEEVSVDVIVLEEIYPTF
ncbi:OOP family OmpA-OmpF porin [Vibrio crassostreae]|uniref:OmpA family protein n=1 Tax=Vibrio crassostreae TaxID=246167 RepID=UPI00119AA952|nr:OmpA family protein [Vibrio crassostreae]TWD40959.1 OOP family OmpA-OmpF porin [Vibrio crassostreae]